MDEWLPLLVLPNLELLTAVECEGIMALVSIQDPRIETLMQDHPQFRDFLFRFRATFGELRVPSIIIAHSSPPLTYRKADAVASFRDLISLSAVLRSRAAGLLHDNARVLFSDAFNIYPWMITASYDAVWGSSPAFQGAHILERFAGQTFPEVPTFSMSDHDLDRPLLDALLLRWRRHYSGRRVRWSDRALFRSLNMANEAAQSPSGVLSTYYDGGRSIGLWVSACEILSHPRTAQASKRTVFSLLEKVEWIDPKLGYRRYLTEKTRSKGGRVPTRRNLACSIYNRIYNVRNDFLHGNPVSSSKLLFPGRKKALSNYAACIYRLALSGYLPLPTRSVLKKTKDYTEYLITVGRHFTPQRMIEKGLKRSM
jgi:hypothetical protein